MKTAVSRVLKTCDSGGLKTCDSCDLKTCVSRVLAIVRAGEKNASPTRWRDRVGPSPEKSPATTPPNPKTKDNTTPGSASTSGKKRGRPLGPELVANFSGRNLARGLFTKKKKVGSSLLKTCASHDMKTCDSPDVKTCDSPLFLAPMINNKRRENTSSWRFREKVD